MVAEKRLILLGFGAVGTRVAELLPRFCDDATTFRIVGVSDSGGGVVCERADGLDLDALLKHKRAGKSVASFCEGNVRAVRDSAELYDAAMECCGEKLDIVVDLSPVNLTTGGPSLPILLSAAKNGVSLVLANKAPLVIAYKRLAETSKASGAEMAFSATVCGGLPVVNVGRRDLACATFHRIAGIFNSTTNYILTEMEAGRDRDEALRHAQQVGIAEADPSLDIEGFDTANKLVIIANAVLGVDATLADCSVTGIQSVTSEDVREAAARSECVRLIASANRRQDGSGYDLCVQPECVPRASFFGSCVESSMCVTFETDIFENVDMKTDEKGVYPTAAAVLRDCRMLMLGK